MTEKSRKTPAIQIEQLADARDKLSRLWLFP
jgi:hypothetical protein